LNTGYNSWKRRYVDVEIKKMSVMTKDALRMMDLLRKLK